MNNLAKAMHEIAKIGRERERVMDKLKPCPFCGGEALTGCFPTDYPTEHCRAYVECKACGAEINVDGRSEDAKILTEKVIDKWNLRPEPRELTFDELRERIGNMSIHIPEFKAMSRAYEHLDHPAFDFKMNLEILLKDYGEMWVAYDRPPGGERP